MDGCATEKCNDNATLDNSKFGSTFLAMGAGGPNARADILITKMLSCPPLSLVLKVAPT